MIGRKHTCCVLGNLWLHSCPWKRVHLWNSYDSVSFEGSMKIKISGLKFLSLDWIVKIDSSLLPNMKYSFNKTLPLWVIYYWKGRLPAHLDLWRGFCGTEWILQGLLETFDVVVYSCKILLLITTEKIYCNLLEQCDKNLFLLHKTSLFLQSFPLF